MTVIYRHCLQVENMHPYTIYQHDIIQIHIEHFTIYGMCVKHVHKGVFIYGMCVKHVHKICEGAMLVLK